MSGMHEEELLMSSAGTDGEPAVTYEEMICLLEACLIEQPFPQNLMSHIAYYFISRFRQSMPALRLLLNSGYPAEAGNILRMLVEYTITLKFIANQPDIRASRFIEEASIIPLHPEFEMLAMAEETKMLDWFHSIYLPYSSAITMHSSRELDELFVPGCHEDCDTMDLLALSCDLAVVLLDCIRSL
ncbi:hypothetical protein HQN87_11920 [Paenibacillus tritici]|uniref:Uncharacterized protein n=2 Tax=Paenibacillus tritici TaxID=1873425 RepID=A0ABX2DPJ5_9BACL|nr:DUF5677 domain-containing protein [Paenibacillus tritici]NQX46039.1 hypothetical protein [Paenibacillus tritici]